MSKRVSDAKAAGVMAAICLALGGAFWVAFLSGGRPAGPIEEASLPPTSRPFDAGPAEGFAKQLEKSGFEIVDMKFEASPADAVTTTTTVQEEVAANPNLPKGLVPGMPDPNLAPTPAFDPDKQPRTFWTMDFRDGDILPPDYKAEGVRKTARGIELEPAAEGEEFRMGTIESPAVKAEFAYNAIAPLWMQEVPEGTSVIFESSMSPDGKTWTDWEAANVPEETISPTMADGSPNPNYGYVPGILQYVSAEDNLFQHLRFRVTLVSETEVSPALNSVRFYIMDSTLGQGRIADASEVARYGNTSVTVRN